LIMHFVGDVLRPLLRFPTLLSIHITAPHTSTGHTVHAGPTFEIGQHGDESTTVLAHGVSAHLQTISTTVRINDDNQLVSLSKMLETYHTIALFEVHRCNGRNAFSVDLIWSSRISITTAWWRRWIISHFLLLKDDLCTHVARWFDALAQRVTLQPKTLRSVELVHRTVQ